jgi:hypothetical protein
MPGMLIGPEEARMILPLPEPTESGGGRQRIFDNGLVMAIARGGRQTGRDVWKGSHVMQRYLSANRAELVAGKRAVELGAGAGYLSMSTHLLGSSLCVHTDKFLELSASNVHTNDCLLQAATGTFVRCACDWDEVQRTGALPPQLAVALISSWQQTVCTMTRSMHTRSWRCLRCCYLIASQAYERAWRCSANRIAARPTSRKSSLRRSRARDSGAHLCLRRSSHQTARRSRG